MLPQHPRPSCSGAAPHRLWEHPSVATRNYCYLVTKLCCMHSFATHGLEPARLLCPWDYPGKNTGVGCHFLFHGIFPTQGLNLCLLGLLHWQADSLPLNHLGTPHTTIVILFPTSTGRYEMTNRDASRPRQTCLLLHVFSSSSSS